MSTLTIYQNGTSHQLEFVPPQPLDVLLQQADCQLRHPCGGRGQCGKCAVELHGEVSEPSAQELLCGLRLSCQAVILGDAVVTLPDTENGLQIETDSRVCVSGGTPMAGRLGLSVDIGTTTLAARLYDLKSGSLLAACSALNPQTSVAADVMGRIDAALHGRLPLLQQQILRAVDTLLREACQKAGCPASEADVLLLTGNTTMLYLLTGRDPVSLARAPFQADTLFGTDTVLLDRRAYLPLCMNAFVGADITCAVLASRMCTRNETALLCDIGTNGEIALWHSGTLYVTSTAAGPAFEGAGISCGCGSVQGAIDRVHADQGQLCIHTIADAPPVGICGSGLIDAVAALLALDEISPTGAIASDGIPLGDPIRLLPADIRAVQLAKAAIAAGIALLLHHAQIDADAVSCLYVAGGFGSHLNLQSAAAIGLLPQALVPRAVVLGNAALAGASMLLLDQTLLADTQAIVRRSQHVPLAGDPLFNDTYIENMLFGDV